VENILQGHPDVDVVFGCNDDSALGALSAMQAAGKDPEKHLVIGFDGTIGAFEEIKKELKIKSLLEQRDRLRNELERMKNQIGQQKNDLVAKERQFREKIRRKNEELDQKNGELEKFQDKLDQLREDITNQKKDLRGGQ